MASTVHLKVETKLLTSYLYVWYNYKEVMHENFKNV